MENLRIFLLTNIDDFIVKLLPEVINVEYWKTICVSLSFALVANKKQRGLVKWYTWGMNGRWLTTCIYLEIKTMSKNFPAYKRNDNILILV